MTAWRVLAILGALVAVAWIIQDVFRGPCLYCDGTGEIKNYGSCDACEGYGR